MPRLLIVEDNAELAENLADVLQTQGHQVVVAPDVDRALECCRNETFQGILSDYRLPGKNGIELIELLRGSANPTPIVLMTGFADSFEQETAAKLGALAVIIKPLNMPRLFEIVDEFARSERKVLLLEDNVVLAHNLAEALEQQGFEPVVVHSVREALAQHQLPRVAVVDYHLPDGNGLDVARQLHARDPSIRVIMLTGHSQELGHDLEMHPPPFIDQTLLKPVGITHLLSAIEQLCGERRGPDTPERPATEASPSPGVEG